MSLIPAQNRFLHDVGYLLLEARGRGCVVTGGELWRTLDQQKIHIANGRSSTLQSRHLDRLAIDLNFFKWDEEKCKYVNVTEDIPNIMHQLGEYWEDLRPGNVWGGRWKRPVDCGHFEHRLQPGEEKVP